MISKTRIFTENQLKTLITGCGFSSITGLDIRDDELSEEDAFNSLREMVNENIVYTMDGNFIMLDDVREMITQIGSAESFLAVRSSNSQLPELCCYIGKKILVCSKDWKLNDNVKMFICDYGDFIDELNAQGYFPFDESEAFDEKNLREYEDRIGLITSDFLIEENEWVLLSAGISDRSDSNNRSLRIISCYLFDYLLLCINDEEKRMVFTIENFKKLFKELIAGCKK